MRQDIVKLGPNEGLGFRKMKLLLSVKRENMREIPVAFNDAVSVSELILTSGV